MKIAIDISQIVYETGVSVYTKNLVTNLLKIDKKNEYILFAGTLRRKQDLNSFFNGLNGNFTTKIFPIPPFGADLLWNKFNLFSLERLIGNIDVYHSSDWVQIPSSAKKITTVHDLAPIKYPNWTNPKIISVHKRRLMRVKNNVDIIITPSQTTKNDLIKLGLDKEKINVIPEAPDRIFTKQTDVNINKLKIKYNVKGKYLLAVGANERKNLKNIISAFELIKIKLGINNLIIIGRQSHNLNMEEGSGVVFTGHVPTNELPIFYSGAEALVYTSLYEGFGLPILEAFATSLPVVTSNVSSMPEVAGDAAVLVNPTNINATASGITKALNNKLVLIKKGKVQVKQFSWKKTARETLDMYEKIQDAR